MRNTGCSRTNVTTPRSLTRAQPVFRVPGIGRRTSMLLYRAGVRTVAQFVALPDFLLAQAFGPSLVTIRQRAARLVETPQPGAYSLLHSIRQRLAAA